MEWPAGGCDGTLRVWDPATLQCLQVLQVAHQPALTPLLNSVHAAPGPCVLHARAAGR